MKPSSADGTTALKPLEWPPIERGFVHMRRKVAVAAAALGVTLTACGGGGSSAPVADDGTVITLPTPEEGPPPDLAVSDAAAATSPLPAVAVRRLNGTGGWSQFKNELPAEQPLLVWFWAPH
jgi:hypothetical protein